jgi:hypothetical protein
MKQLDLIILSRAKDCSFGLSTIFGNVSEIKDLTEARKASLALISYFCPTALVIIQVEKFSTIS